MNKMTTTNTNTNTSNESPASQAIREVYKKYHKMWVDKILRLMAQKNLHALKDWMDKEAWDRAIEVHTRVCEIEAKKSGSPFVCLGVIGTGEVEGKIEDYGRAIVSILLHAVECISSEFAKALAA